MGKIAFLFAGQGAQYSGMGKSLTEISPKAKALFELVDSIRPETSQQCFEGDTAELTQTKNTQPCVFTVDLASAYALEEAGVHADAAAGFSLGEMAALTFAGSFSENEGFSLVCRRGELMQEAAEKYPSAMAAVLKLSDKAVEELCANFPDVYPVNYNCPGQLVVAGGRDHLEDVYKRQWQTVPTPLGVASILGLCPLLKNHQLCWWVPIMFGKSVFEGGGACKMGG